MDQNEIGHLSASRKGCVRNARSWSRDNAPMRFLAAAFDRQARATAASLASALCATLAACAPSLNWRETLLEGPGLAAVFPCRPVAHSRPLSLAGRPVTMKLMACEADHKTFAVSAADMGDPTRVDAGLQALRDTSMAKLAGGTPPQTKPLTISGMTPRPSAGRWALGRPGPDGGVLRMDMAVFAHGTWVIQATVIGRTPGGEANEPFFEGLHFGHEEPDLRGAS
jgi:hypothetical protein